MAEAILVELYRRRWEQGRRAECRRILTDQGIPSDWYERCCLSGLPIRRDACVRGFLLVREEHMADTRTEVGYGFRYFERWRSVGLPLAGRYRYADSNVVPQLTDIAWRCLRTYFRQRYNLRLQPAWWRQQIEAATMGRRHIGHPDSVGNQERPWFELVLALEPAYRWLATIVGKGTKERRDRRSFRRSWVEWRRQRREEIDPRLPFADERDNAESFLIAVGIRSEPRTKNGPYTEDMALLGILPRGPAKQGAPFGLGPALHAVLRHDPAALRALLDCKLVFHGMDDLGLELHPRCDGRLFSACELGRESGDLRAQFARWAAAQYRKLNLPAAD